MAENSNNRCDNGVVKNAPARKIKKKTAKIDTVVKELAVSNAKILEMNEQLKRAQETILSLQATLGASMDGPPEVSSVIFENEIGPSSTRRKVSGTDETAMEVSRFMSSVNQISISTVNVPECKSTVEGEEIGKFEFESWKELLTDSMTLAGITDEQTQFIVFKVKAGSKLMEIYKSTKSTAGAPDPVTYPFANAMYRLKTYFGSSSDIMLLRRKLNMLAQKPDESDLAFVTRVGAMARMCDYDDEKEFEEIASTVAEHATTEAVRATALNMLSRQATLTDLVDKVRRIQAIKLNEEYYRRRHGTVNQVAVASVSIDRGRSQHRDFARESVSRGHFGGQQRNDEMPRRRLVPSRWKSPERCFRCNSVFHKPVDCSAIDKNCLKCGRRGHFKRACKSFIRTGNKRVSETDDFEVEAKRIALVDLECAAKEVEKKPDDDVGDNKH